MTNVDYAWLRYADLQERSKKTTNIDDYSWGIEAALNYLLDAIQAGTLSSDHASIDAAIGRAIASRARLHRSHSLARRKWLAQPESLSTNAGAEARMELEHIENSVSKEDEEILLDCGLGYTDKEIAARHASTPGAIRVRLSRLRHRLSAPSHIIAHKKGHLAHFYGQSITPETRASISI